jgi:hypothetical protein
MNTWEANWSKVRVHKASLWRKTLHLHSHSVSVVCFPVFQGFTPEGCFMNSNFRSIRLAKPQGRQWIHEEAIFSLWRKTLHLHSHSVSVVCFPVFLSFLLCKSVFKLSLLITRPNCSRETHTSLNPRPQWHATVWLWALSYVAFQLNAHNHTVACHWGLGFNDVCVSLLQLGKDRNTGKHTTETECECKCKVLRQRDALWTLTFDPGIPVLSLVQERVQVMSHSNLMPTTTQSRATEALDIQLRQNVNVNARFYARGMLYEL